MVERLAEADAGIEPDPLLGDAGARRRTPAAPRGTPSRRRPRRRSAGSSCIVRGSPSMCIRQQSTPASATRPASAGSKRKADTSLTIDAPASIAAARDLDLRRVDRDARAPRGEPLDHRAARGAAPRSASTGSCAGTGRLAADVEDVRALVEQLAAVGDGGLRGENSPPSENESGVTLTTPMTASTRRAYRPTRGALARGRDERDRLTAGRLVARPPRRDAAAGRGTRAAWTARSRSCSTGSRSRSRATGCDVSFASP